MAWDIGAFEYSTAKNLIGESNITVTAQGNLGVVREMVSQVTIMIAVEGYLEVVFDTYGPYPDNWDDDEVFG